MTQKSHMNPERSAACMAIMREVAERHGVSVGLMQSANRARHIFAARAEYCYRVRREVPGMSFPMIGVTIGQHHASVISAIRKVVLTLRRGDEWAVVPPPAERRRRRRKTAEERAAQRRRAELRREHENAARINAYWLERGKIANAVVVEDADGCVRIETRFEDAERRAA